MGTHERTQPERTQPPLPPAVISDGPAPKHAQLREILQRYSTTQLHPGDALPGERVIEVTYGVSRITVRRAIGDLVASGHLRRARGKGTFVAPAPLVSRMHLASLSSEMGAHNVEASSKILRSERAFAPAEVTEFFGAQADATMHTHLRRLRLGDGAPYAIDDAWYNARYVPDLLENDVYRSVYTILDEVFDQRITDADQIVSAIAATPSHSELLGVPVGTPLLHIERHARSSDHPIEWCSSVYRTDRYRLATRVTDQGAF